jgi:hypothetical protein
MNKQPAANTMRLVRYAVRARLSIVSGGESMLSVYGRTMGTGTMAQPSYSLRRARLPLTSAATML